MFYTAEHIDVEKFEEALTDKRQFQLEEKRLKIRDAEHYFAGYEDCIDHVRSMFRCSNYESSEKKSVAYQAGADNAFYELCKELDISCPEARDMTRSIDEKAAILAEIIKIVCYNAEDAP